MPPASWRFFFVSGMCMTVDREHVLQTCATRRPIVREHLVERSPLEVCCKKDKGEYNCKSGKVRQRRKESSTPNIQRRPPAAREASGEKLLSG